MALTATKASPGRPHTASEAAAAAETASISTTTAAAITTPAAATVPTPATEPATPESTKLALAAGHLHTKTVPVEVVAVSVSGVSERGWWTNWRLASLLHLSGAEVFMLTVQKIRNRAATDLTARGLDRVHSLVL